MAAPCGDRAPNPTVHQLGDRAGLLYTVNTTSDTVVVGACENGNAGCSLRGAIESANAHVGADGISIELSADSVINLTEALPSITDSVGIAGPGADLLIVRRFTGGDYRIFNVTTSGTVTFSGMTISDGNSVDGDGGGGGVQNKSGGTVNITNCVLSGNATRAFGGGIFNEVNGTVNVINSTLNGNSTPDVNGGADGGGGIFNHGTVNVTNSTLSGNSTAGDGGGILNEGTVTEIGIMNVTNSTLSRDSGNPGGIFNSTFSTVPVNVRGSTIALNTFAVGLGPDVVGTFNSQGFNLIGEADGSTGFTQPTDQTGTIASPLDPKLDPNGLQDNGGPTQTIGLLFGSPAIARQGSGGALATAAEPLND